MNTPAPVRLTRRLRLPPQEAFDLFTTGMQRWWPLASHSCSGDKSATLEFEPRLGGALTEIAPDGTRHAWGRVLEWDPPRRFALRWHPGRDAAEATRLEVRFVAIDGGCELQLCHDGWEARGAAANDVRGSYESGWPVVLDALGALAASTEEK